MSAILIVGIIMFVVVLVMFGVYGMMFVRGALQRRRAARRIDLINAAETAAIARIQMATQQTIAAMREVAHAELRERMRQRNNPWAS